MRTMSTPICARSTQPGVMRYWWRNCRSNRNGPQSMTGLVALLWGPDRLQRLDVADNHAVAIDERNLHSRNRLHRAVEGLFQALIEKLSYLSDQFALTADEVMVGARNLDLRRALERPEHLGTSFSLLKHLQENAPAE